MAGVSSDPIVVKDATCTYCGCLCDDIELHATGDRIVRAARACTLGRAWFFNHAVEHGLPAALINGRPAALGAAVEAAAALLDAADLPLVYGLGNSTCESQRAAIKLAERIGGVIDSHTSLTHGPTKIAGQLVGKLTCTLGEVKNRADLIVYWGTNPVESHPRHLTKFTLTPRGKFVPGGRKDRTMVLVDVRETLSARASDLFLQVHPGADLEVLTALRAMVHGRALDRRLVEATGVTVDRLEDLVRRMKHARFGVFFFGSGLTTTRGRHANVAALLMLTAELNNFTKFAAIPMRDYGNEAGADNVMSWQAGYPFGIDFTRGYPRSNPGESTAVDLLVRQDVDAALVVAADPWSTMPNAALEHLDRIPRIVIDRKITAASRAAAVHFTTAAPGISSSGTAYRMDKVPIPLRAALSSPHGSDEDVLRGIHDAIVASRRPSSRAL
ncbi:MAG: formylmethanofuran dehydrogenase subunit B [Acidobacteriota bacterium]